MYEYLDLNFVQYFDGDQSEKWRSFINWFSWIHLLLNVVSCLLLFKFKKDDELHAVLKKKLHMIWNFQTIVL